MRVRVYSNKVRLNFIEVIWPCQGHLGVTIALISDFSPKLNINTTSTPITYTIQSHTHTRLLHNTYLTMNFKLNTKINITPAMSS